MSYTITTQLTVEYEGIHDQNQLKSVNTDKENCIGDKKVNFHTFLILALDRSGLVHTQI